MRGRSSAAQMAGLVLTAATGLASCSSSSTAPEPKAHPDGVIAAVVPLSGRPFGVAISQAGDVLISRQDANLVTRGTIAPFAFGTNIVVGQDPGTLALAPDGSRAYVANFNDHNMGVVSMASNTQVTTIALGDSPFQVKASPDGHTVYAATGVGPLSIFEAASLAQIGGFGVGGGPNGMAFNPAGSLLYVSSIAARTVTEISTATNTISRTVPVGTRPQEIAISPDGGELWVADEVDGVTVFDLSGANPTQTLAGTEGAFGMAMSPDGARLYVTIPSRGVVAIIDRKKRTVLPSLVVGVPRRIAFDATGLHAVVADEAWGAILIQ